MARWFLGGELVGGEMVSWWRDGFLVARWFLGGELVGGVMVSW